MGDLDLGLHRFHRLLLNRVSRKRKAEVVSCASEHVLNLRQRVFLQLVHTQV